MPRRESPGAASADARCLHRICSGSPTRQVLYFRTRSRFPGPGFGSVKSFRPSRFVAMNTPDALQNRNVYSQLLSDFQRSAGQAAELRWRWLAAAHIVGQSDFRLHCHVHGVMFRYAVRMRDWPEAGGQLFRLALVPLGHLLGKLPAGNIGRATVSAFQPMPLSSDMREIIAKARSVTAAQVRR